MKKLCYYDQFLTTEQKNAVDALNGYRLELAVKGYAGKELAISKPGKVDVSLPIAGKVRRVEIKQNGGDFRLSCKGNSYIVYAVYIDPDKPLREQFGYVMPMDVFRTCGNALHHIRAEKIDSAGHKKMALQTLYNYKQGDFHGAKAFKLSAMWEEMGAIPFKEFFNGAE